LGRRVAALEDLDVIDSKAWAGRRVLITGHTGFKGGWLSIWLRSLGAEIAGYSLDPPTQPSFYNATGVGACLADHRGDIRDAAGFRKVVEAFDPEVVFHLAAQSIVRKGYREPVETYSTNVVGTAVILDGCRRAPSLRAVVCVTSDKCYENRDWARGYREDDRLGGFDPYSNSKACAELVTDAFRRSFYEDASPRIGVATARAGNVIGGGDWGPDRLVPDLARAVATGDTAVIRNPQAVRPWQHVLEPLSGYITLAESLIRDAEEYSGAWNFGPGRASLQTVETVVGIMGKYWKGKLKWSTDSETHPPEAARLVLDSTKAASYLHWSTRLTLEDTLRLAVEWYDAFDRGGVDLLRLTESQIASYSGLAAS